ncbi:laccase-10-like, partial [Anoplophora glabripennis]
MPQLESLEKWDTSLKSKPDLQYYIAYDFYELDNSHFHKAPYYGFNNISDINLALLTPQFNHISMKTPSFPLLPQRNEITKDMFCNKDTVKDKNCVENYCECPHGIHVPLDAVVELVFVDEGFAYDANHPLHIHGHNFRIVAMERLGENVTVEEVQDRDRQGLIKRNLLDAPLKDTVTVPDGGYTIVRFVASNP